MQGSTLNFMGYRGEGCWVTETIPRLRLLFVEKLILLTRPINVEGGSNFDFCKNYRVYVCTPVSYTGSAPVWW